MSWRIASIEEVDVPGILHDPARLTTLQLLSLNAVLARARETAYYAERLVGLPEQLHSLDELRLFPVTRKTDVLQDIALHPPFGTRLRVPPAEITQIVTTSGTSGAGQEVYPLNAEDEEMMHRMAARGFAWAGVDSASIVLNTLPLTTTAAGQWYYHGLKLLGATVLSVGSSATKQKVEYIQRFHPDVLVGNPSYLLRLASEARGLGSDSAELGVQRIVVAGESWSERWMRRLEHEWGARVYEQYGCTQRGMAWTCPKGALTEQGRGTLHALSDFGIYEVIEPSTGLPLEGPGQGELVITPFASGASPLVRFSTGDRVRVVPSCGCGRPGPCFIAGTFERYDFMVKVRGVNVWPEALDAAVFCVTTVRDYEAEIRTDPSGREVFSVAIELDRDDDDVPRMVAEAIGAATGLHATVSVLPQDTIAQHATDRFQKRRRLSDKRETNAG
jgi:phenylacetate-CoA ligase